MILFELLAPYVLCLFLLPLVVKARIKDAYGHTKKQTTVSKQVEFTKKVEKSDNRVTVQETQKT